MKPTSISLTSIMLLVTAMNVHPATPSPSTNKTLVGGLESYEPTSVGLTHDSDDVEFMDFKISFKYRLVKRWISDPYQLFFAFTGRFGQYIGTRPSSPVIEKRFNPKLFVRRVFGDCQPDLRDYVDIAYAHESNGQSIDSYTQFNAAVNAGKPMRYVFDDVSRGWDYIEITGKKILAMHPSDCHSSDDPPTNMKPATSGYVQLKYFLPHGLLQGKAEEFDPYWERLLGVTEGKPRRAVNGIGGVVQHDFGTDTNWSVFTKPRLAAIYETGYSPAFRNHTFRGEIGGSIAELPIVLWGQRGYGSDLAQYYKKVTSWGIEVQIGSY